MFFHQIEGRRAAELESNFAPRRHPAWFSIFTATSSQRIEFRADEHCHSGLGNLCNRRLNTNLRHAHPSIRLGAVLGEMIQQRQRVRFAAAEIRGEVEHRRSMARLPGHPAHRLGGQVEEIGSEERFGKKLFRIAVIRPGGSIPYPVQMHRELGCILRFAFAQILPRLHHIIPRF